MRLRVRLFAVAKELAGRDELLVDLPPGVTVADLQAHVTAEYPALKNILSHALWAVDTNYATPDTSLNENSNIALIPPVSGG